MITKATGFCFSELPDLTCSKICMGDHHDVVGETYECHTVPKTIQFY